MQRKLWVAILVIAAIVIIWQQRGSEPSTDQRVVVEQPRSTNSVASPPAQETSQSDPQPETTSANSYPDYLPDEALDTIALIEKDGPFPYSKDGSVFQNRERQLPNKPRGYYREYTVDTPGSRDRGARRIVTGGEPVETYCYTEDHYRSFRCFEARP
jgi:ribonuclease T1